MRTRIQKWGNSLALRIPRAFAAEAGLEQGRSVEISVEDGRLIIAPAAETLEALLADVRPDNLHGEVDTGDAVGNEGW
jgi:antitoxin MazE